MGAVTDFMYGRTKMPGWVWPAFLLVMGLVAFLLSVVFYRVVMNGPTCSACALVPVAPSLRPRATRVHRAA